MVTLGKVQTLPYYQIFNEQNEVLKFYGSDLESYLSFSNLYDNEYLKTRPCTAKDFAGIEHVYEMKT